jgi:hypothetical protein
LEEKPEGQPELELELELELLALELDSDGRELELEHGLGEAGQQFGHQHPLHVNLMI